MCCSHEAELSVAQASLRSVQSELDCLKQEHYLHLKSLSQKNASLRQLIEQKRQILQKVGLNRLNHSRDLKALLESQAQAAKAYTNEKQRQNLE